MKFNFSLAILFSLFSANILLAENLNLPDYQGTKVPEYTAPAKLQSHVARFFVSSNTQATIGVFNIFDANTRTMSNFGSQALDADGIYYDAPNDVLYQLNRENQVVNAYSNVNDSIAAGGTLQLTATSPPNFTNGREIAFVDGKMVVVQDADPSNGNMNRFIIYNASATSFTLDKLFDIDFNLWGIHISGNTLYAVEDNSNRLAVFNNFFDNPTGTVTPDAVIAVDGLIRTHGITYDAEDDLMILTDIGSAGSANDGALVIIRNFTSAAADSTISSGEQIRVSGAASKLGNPVDVALDKERNTLFVAERANGGGRVLGFRVPVASGGIAPIYDVLFAGASAINLPYEVVGLCDFVDGGKVTFTTGETTKTIFIDGKPDVLSFSSNIDAMAGGYNFTYVITDANGIILGIPPSNMTDFDPAGTGDCHVYGLSYTGNLNIAPMDDLLDSELQISDDCFDLSDNFLVTNRINPAPAQAQFFVSSNTQASIGVFSILDANTIVASSFSSGAGDADGIYYDESNDVLYQLNRSDDIVAAYSAVSDSLATGGNPQETASSPISNFTNGREIAFVNGKLVVADDADASNGNMNRLYVYDATGTSITLDKVFDVSINLWGIQITGNTLYAVEDNSNRLAVFNNFFDNASGPISPNSLISVDGLVRTHGLTYVADRDMMIMTDIGDAGSATDGAIVVIRRFTAASSDDNISSSEQVRVSGAASKLGNPVDVAFDSDRNTIFVAERANGGGRILGFRNPSATGGIAPVYNTLFAGASAIHLPGFELGLCDFVDGGKVTFTTGETFKTIFIDGNPDVLSFNSSVDAMAAGHSFTYVITDASGIILGIPPSNMNDFDPAGTGDCRVYGLSYTGNLQISAMDDLLANGLQISDDCFDLSDNYLVTNRINPTAQAAEFYVSSNTQSVIGAFDILSADTRVMRSFGSVAADADGIYYDEMADVLYQLNRSSNVINAYSNVRDSLAAGSDPDLTATSTSDFSNGREIAVANGKLVVAQDAAASNGDQNSLVVYDISPTSITFNRVNDLSINLWGIQISGTTLYAVEDNSNRLAVFNNFLAQASGTLNPDAMITVEGLVRTHGLAYDAQNDMMLLTDIGDASSATDGAFVVIKNFTSASANGTISNSEQIRVSGAASQLGNPVDIAVDSDRSRVYIAERANGGGKVLGFKFPVLSGGIAPVYSVSFAGASAIHLPGVNDMNFDENEVEVASFNYQPAATVAFEKLYPVPATTELNLKLESTSDQQIQIMIYDNMGILKELQEVGLYKGSNTLRFDVSSFNTGYYFISVPSMGYNAKFLKVLR